MKIKHLNILLFCFYCTLGPCCKHSRKIEGLQVGRFTTSKIVQPIKGKNPKTKLSFTPYYKNLNTFRKDKLEQIHEL
jgi:hypothetical protein